MEHLVFDIKEAAQVIRSIKDLNYPSTLEAYVEGISARLTASNQEAALYLLLQQALEQEPGNFLLLKKAAYLALYLGHMDDAYHWAICLEVYSPSPTPQTRKRRLELYLRKTQPATDYQAISGRVFFRSTSANFKQGDAPGESSILDANLERIALIRKITDWDHISSGTLNLYTDVSPNEIKTEIPACAYEPAVSVTYPSSHAQIPKKRIGYWYYHGFIHYQGSTLPALFRYPEFPVDDRVLEVFSPQNLKNTLQLSEGDRLLCYFCPQDTAIDAWLECKLQIHALFTKNAQPFGRNQTLYQGHEGWGLPGQRPTLLRMTSYALDQWITSAHHILDIGCNIGCLGLEASKFAASYTGLDSNQDLISIANLLASHHGIKNCRFITSNFHDFLKRDTRKYDIIFSFAVHVWLEITIKEYASLIRELLHPQGIVIIESNTLATNDKDFIPHMHNFLETGFRAIHQGRIKDDGLIERAFFVFQRTE